MDLWGYGEDALTLWALHNRGEKILSRLGDNTVPDDATAIYRPSFGRNASHDGQRPRASFGEFDAILRTPEAIYLIETKWTCSSEFKKRSRRVCLGPEQERRHHVMRAYLGEWARTPAENRAAFPAQDLGIEGLAIPGEGRTLRANLRWVCERLAPQPDTPIHDVLLWIAVGQGPVPVAVNPDTYQLVVIDAEGVEAVGFIQPTPVAVAV